MAPAQPLRGGPVRDVSLRRPIAARRAHPSEKAIRRLSDAVRLAEVICLTQSEEDCVLAWGIVDRLMDES